MICKHFRGFRPSARAHRQGTSPGQQARWRRPTLIFTPSHTADSQALWKAAGSLGWRTERLASWRVPDHFSTLDEPVPYGEALFGPSLAEQLGLSLLNPPEDWLVRLPMEYKHRHIALTTLGEACARIPPGRSLRQLEPDLSECVGDEFEPQNRAVERHQALLCLSFQWQQFAPAVRQPAAVVPTIRLE